MTQQKLSCDKCGSEHDQIHDRLAADRATFREKEHYVSHYGSDFDGSVHRIVRDEVPDAKAICDGCVTELKESGAIVFERNFLDGRTTDA